METEIKLEKFKHKGLVFKKISPYDWEAVHRTWTVSTTYNPGSTEDTSYWTCIFHAADVTIFELGVGDTFEEAFTSASKSYIRGITREATRSKRAIHAEQRYLEKLAKH